MLRCLIILGFILGSVSIFGNSRFFDRDPDDYQFFLHTFDAGDMIYSNFGHTALRIKQGSGYDDLVFNWGIFDFGSPLTFAANYYKGNLIYRMGFYPMQRARQFYKMEPRKIWQDELNLTRDQKQFLLRKIKINSLPENLSYRYQYFFDNCSTKLRDLLDEALNGALALATKNQSQGASFRDAVRQGYRVNPWMDVILEVGMNSRIDRDMSQWEAMFHPLYLRQHLSTLSNMGQPILGASQLLHDAAPLEQPTVDVFVVLAFVLGLLVITAMGLLQAASLYQAKKPEFGARLAPIGLRTLGFVGMIFFLVGGIFGLLMPLNWLFSGHSDLHHNINMMLFLPLDILLTYICGYLVWKKEPFPSRGGSYGLIKKYISIHILLTLALGISWSLGDVKQSLARVIYLVPVCVLILGLLLNFGIKQQDK